MKEPEAPLSLSDTSLPDTNLLLSQSLLALSAGWWECQQEWLHQQKASQGVLTHSLPMQHFHVVPSLGHPWLAPP